MNRRRTVRRWLVTAAVLAVAGIAAAVALPLAPDGTVEQRLRQDGTVTVGLDPRTPLLVRSRNADGIDCEVRQNGGFAATTFINAQFDHQHKLRTGGETLYAVLDVRADPAGVYELWCGGAAAGVGEAPWTYRMRQNVLAGVLTVGPPLSDTGLVFIVALPVVLAAAIVVRLLRRPSGRRGQS